ncbi:MAG: hypothetical protein KA099_03090 [Alphaproteobacteria bacterium]|nr:hypothetical protein [Alphaproteobacteria bacterium]MBP7759328.1 hypothetical protein [Alphaproteobacteria bacterium]MBP7762541.1 hypothetical protein [Alphaproteobacteria bacterium]MBP7904288.1 hypothetical protein [Alphaproteobacteria bacterium]
MKVKDLLNSKIEPEVVLKWTLNLSLELVVCGLLLGGIIGVLFFWRVGRPAKHRAVIGAFTGFFLSIFGVLALLIFAELYQFLAL